MSDISIVREAVELQVSGSSAMRAYVARPSVGGPYPALIVFQEAYGVNGHIRNVTDRFAAEGFVAIAPELFHRTAPRGFEGDYKNFSSVTPHFQAITNEGAAADIRSTYEWLRSSAHVNRDSISCVGFCMGGKSLFSRMRRSRCARRCRSTEAALLRLYSIAPRPYMDPRS